MIPVFINIETNKIPLHYYTTLLPVNAAVNNSYSKQLAAAPQIHLVFVAGFFLSNDYSYFLTISFDGSYLQLKEKPAELDRLTSWTSKKIRRKEVYVADMSY